MITFKANTDKFSRALKGLSAHVNVSTATFLKTEGRMLQQELVKRFQPKMPKAQKGVIKDRQMAFGVKPRGLTNIPWLRLQRIINREKASGRKPIVQASVANPAAQKAVKALGTLAAGWIGRGNKLGAKAKGFVLSHVTDAHGDVTFINGLLTKRLRIRNFTPWLGNLRNRAWLVKKAISVRTSAMRNTAKRLAAGLPTYWKGVK
jgi:hypothetical protein